MFGNFSSKSFHLHRTLTSSFIVIIGKRGFVNGISYDSSELSKNKQFSTSGIKIGIGLNDEYVDWFD